MKPIEPIEAIRIISETALTIVVIDAQGAIRECIPFDTDPPLEWMHENRERFSGCAVKDIRKQQLSLEELQEIIKDAAKWIEMFRRYES